MKDSWCYMYGSVGEKIIQMPRQFISMHPGNPGGWSICFSLQTLPYLSKQSDHLHAFWFPLPAGSKYHQPPSCCCSSACTNTQPIWSSRSHDRLSFTHWLFTHQDVVCALRHTPWLSITFLQNAAGSNHHRYCFCLGFAHFIDCLHTASNSF